jgi:lipopolysaccharide/colanic/teichoic acid biosynthesis glycosyltransferase
MFQNPRSMFHGSSESGKDAAAITTALSEPGLAEPPQTTAAVDGWRYRAFDLFFVAIAVPTVALTLLIIIALVKLDDPKAPVFYVQTRYGRRGKPFGMIKIRSMVPDADRVKDTLIDHSIDKGAGFKLDHDPRVTRPGRILRKFYLDELPQLWNVLRGDMAVVGPRANSTNPADLEPWQRQRLAVRPGITGSWQVMREKPRNFDERCRIDLDYIAQKSLIGDIRILFRTVLVMLVRPTGL